MLFFPLSRGRMTVRVSYFRRSVIAVVVALSASPLCAAAPAADAMQNIASAVRAAWIEHPAADASEQTLVAARARASASSLPIYNPELELAVDDEGADRSTTAGIGMTLDLHGKRRARSAAGDATLALAEAEAHWRRSTFAQAWLHAWADHQTAQHRVQLGAQRVGLVQRFADLAEKQLSVGDISSLERDLALLARDQGVAEQAILLADAAAAEEAFRIVGGVPAQAPAISAAAIPPELVASDEHLLDVPEQKIALAQSMQADSLVRVAERERRADPTLSLRAGKIDFGPSTDNIIGLSFSMPLFVRNDHRAEVVAAQADHDAAAAEQRVISMQVAARAERTRATYTAVRDAWMQWARSPGTDVASRASLLERLWRAGEVSTADYLIQLQQTLDTTLAGADLQGRVWRAYVDALYATGQLDAWVRFDRSTVEVTP